MQTRCKKQQSLTTSPRFEYLLSATAWIKSWTEVIQSKHAVSDLLLQHSTCKQAWRPVQTPSHGRLWRHYWDHWNTRSSSKSSPQPVSKSTGRTFTVWDTCGGLRCLVETFYVASASWDDHSDNVYCSSVWMHFFSYGGLFFFEATERS